jgi:signal transduction histidine kinase
VPCTTCATVLVAVSQRDIESSLRNALQDDGHFVVTASRSAEVLSMLSAERIDLVILDALEDWETSYALCADIKARVDLGFIPVAMLDDTDDLWIDGDDAPDAVLAPPVDRRELNRTIRYLMRQRRQFARLLPGAPANRAHEIEMLRADIIRNVSHELVTPLLQVRTVISMLLDPAYSAERTPTLDTMAREAAARLGEVVDNIQQLAQAHAITLAPFIVDDALAGAIRHLERSWTWQSQVGRIEVDSSAQHAIALGDRAATARLLQLLLENALKFSPEDAPVRLIAAPAEGNRVWFAVEDYGIGIPYEEQEHIFEAFYQVDRSPRRRYEGTGIGLALALLLADGMGTAIEVDSAPGQGSTFSFTLPLVDGS